MCKKIFFTFLFSAIMVVAFAQSSVEAKVWKNVEALNKAIFVDKDSVALESLVNSDVTYGHSGGNVEDKKLMIKKALANISTYKDVKTERISIKIVGNTAVARHIISATENREGKESLLKLNVLQVWQKLYGKWKLIARQSAKVPTT
ncbi:nuclear transport factor 2 family protein [Ferruginibacter lapsinanis]|uniref:nuclear transport factor 2 family protein n=1 Tax=Ferruginibacter lapsinanis TaxID=563172 RepID=UPI001E4A7445|nr:nuclear transport factor 2 family protein [Ferruginibacter lapsinanis]UEG50015.1 nuclear transport factor 2 family protein [Ferruginibacter lapsinanis]